MNEWFASLQLAPWLPVVASFFIGIAVGWLWWGGRPPVVVYGEGEEAREGDADGARAAVAAAPKTEPPLEDKQAAKALFSGKPEDNEKSKSDPAPKSMKVGALESELRKAHELLEEASEEREGYAEYLVELEDALKRANGRLKMLTKAVKKTKPEA